MTYDRIGIKSSAPLESKDKGAISSPPLASKVDLDQVTDSHGIKYKTGIN